MNKLLISNVAYGNVYSDIFLNTHLKSFLDPSNIPATKDRVEYLLFSDHETMPKIEAHPNWQKLKSLVPCQVAILEFPPGQPIDKFAARYSILITMFNESVKKAIERDMWLSAIVADHVVAQDFLPKVLAKMDAGHGAVFVQPPRAAAESTMPLLQQNPRALSAHDLWDLCYRNMHPLWVACHWNAPQFSALPFSLLWNNSEGGLLVRSFSITPMVFQPKQEMLNVGGVIDREMPALCENPFWATDWVDCPVIGVEPLFCYYPPFVNKKASTDDVRDWSVCLAKCQLEFVTKKLYFPSEERARISEEMIEHSDHVIKTILTED